jgi:hypothetical protein
VGYNTVDELVRLEAGDVGERRWPGGDTESLSGVAYLIGIPRLRSRSVAFRNGIVARAS